MTDVTHLNDSDGSVLLAREIDDLLLRARGLVLVRDLLAERGATSAEVDAHTNELERTRRQLALIIGGGGAAEPSFGEAA
jgi:hypothetical protein